MAARLLPERSGVRAKLPAFLVGVAAAAALCWPAIWNRYPLLDPDATVYMTDGHLIWGALLGHRDPAFVPGRPAMYSWVILLLHWQRSTWPIVLMQAALTAWVLWLVVRSVRLRFPVATYAAIMAILAACTSVSWCVSRPLPDILGPLVYLGAALLVFAEETLSRRERWGLAALCVVGIASHPSHLVVIFGLAGLLAALWLVRWSALREHRRSLTAFFAIVLAAVVAQCTLQSILAKKLTLTGTRPVYLMARMTSDGPAREYLKTHCATLSWVICRYQDKLDGTDDTFLWQPAGVWMSASAADRDAMRKEETPLVLATLRTYPREQAWQSWANVEALMNSFAIDDFDANAFVAMKVDDAPEVGPGIYPRTRQSYSGMPQYETSKVLYGAVRVSSIVILALLPGVWRDRRLMGLAVVVGFTVLLNGASAAVLSGIYARYQDRVVWMVVLLAMLMLAERLSGSRRVDPAL